MAFETVLMTASDGGTLGGVPRLATYTTPFWALVTNTGAEPDANVTVFGTPNDDAVDAAVNMLTESSGADGFSFALATAM
jgi:hypothetical protein